MNFEEGETFRGEPGTQIVLIFRNQKLGERSEAQKNYYFVLIFIFFPQLKLPSDV